MQKQMVEGMHTLSHAFSESDTSHHQEDHLLGHEHSHDHKLISFFSKIFSSEEKTDNHEGIYFNYTFDKHFAQEYPPVKFKFTQNIVHIFHYAFHIPKSVKAIPSPPPEVFFS